MTIIFEDENDVVVHALDKIICYARQNQYILVAQSVWWIASIIGLTDGLIMHVDNLRIPTEGYQTQSKVEQLSSQKEVASTLQDNVKMNPKER